MAEIRPSHALIGHTGFVGSTLKKQHRFSHTYRSTDIQELEGKELDLIICAGAPAKKWLANQEPDDDQACIKKLTHILATIKAKQFVLISTVDVFTQPLNVNESTEVQTAGLHPYGLHRFILEQFVANQFPSHLIIRLPGLVGPGLKKNIIFDLLHHNNLDKVDHRSVFQFYPMVNLWSDIQIALRSGLDLLHLTAEPCSVAEVSLEGFGSPFSNAILTEPPLYDFRSLHAGVFGGQGHYQYSRRESIQAIRAYAQSELPL
jgi:dTDP-4-dehydrorhamnose reductase